MDDEPITNHNKNSTDMRKPSSRLRLLLRLLLISKVKAEREYLLYQEQPEHAGRKSISFAGREKTRKVMLFLLEPTQCGKARKA